jgi:DNA-binding response OmpR family regulator
MSEMRESETDSILLVESDPHLRKVVSASLEQIGVKTHEASQAQDAQRILRTEQPSILIVERDFPHGENGKLIEEFRSHRGQDRSHVVVTTTNRLSTSWRKQHQPKVVVYKPFDVRHLCRVIRALLLEPSKKTLPEHTA